MDESPYRALWAEALRHAVEEARPHADALQVLVESENQEAEGRLSRLGQLSAALEPVRWWWEPESPFSQVCELLGLDPEVVSSRLFRGALARALHERERLLAELGLHEAA